MKKNILPLILIVGFISMAFTRYIQQTQPVKLPQPKKIVKVEIQKPQPLPIVIKLKNHQGFLDAIGDYESGNRYNIVNRFGYMGKYQFGKSTLKSLDINVSRKTFLNSPYLQEEAMERLMLDNYKTLKRYIKKYDGKIIHGVFVTKSGTLAAAHLVGAGAVSKWFRRGTQAKDANGTRLTTYMKVFSNYDLDI